MAELSEQVKPPVESLFNAAKLVRGMAFALGRAKKRIADQQDEKSAEIAMEEAQRKQKAFVDLPIDAVLKEKNVNPRVGLSSGEATRRLAVHGPNELDKKPPKSFWALLLGQFTDVIVILLVAAAVISISLGEVADAVAILLIVTANATIGVTQEMKAEAAIDALASLAAPRATVLRDGEWKVIDSREVTVGDIVRLQTGCTIPADLRLIETRELQCNEMPLTGEAEGVRKDASFLGGQVEDGEGKLTPMNMAFMGCTVLDGNAKGVVASKGMETRMGHIARLMHGADPGMSPLQRRLQALGVKLGVGAIVVCLLVFIVGVSTDRGSDPHSDQAVWLQMLLVSVGLAVAAVPEGLPTAVLIALSIGLRDMVKRNVLIRNLHSVETLGSATVICTDKTGTLTYGEMTAQKLWFLGRMFQFTGPGGYNPEGKVVPDSVDKLDESAIERATEALEAEGSPQAFPLVVGYLCSNATLRYDVEAGEWKCIGNTTERPLVVASKKAGLDGETVNKMYPRVKENPFNSKRKMMSVLVDTTQADHPLLTTCSHAAMVKGAPNVVLQRATRIVCQDEAGRPVVKKLTREDAHRIEQDVVKTLSDQALRVLALAYRPFTERPGNDGADVLENELVLVGLIASIDPARMEVADSIRNANRAGIRVVMITGDYVRTALAIAKNIQLLKRDSPDAKARDCKVVREFGNRIEVLEEQLKTAKREGNHEVVLRVQEELRVTWDELDVLTSFVDVYARAKPEDKITIVRSLQRQGHVCSMTGDGVNDAPALKQANIGVAMGITGTDVAKNAASMVLTDDNFVSIVSAIEQGRIIYANIRKFVSFLLSTNVAEIAIIFLSICIGLQTPLLPIQLLWMNLVTDGAPALALALEKGDPSIMGESPRPVKEDLVEKVMVTGIVVQCFALTAAVLTSYIVGLSWNTGAWDGKNDSRSVDELEDGLAVARTMAFLTISLSELFRGFTVRNERLSLFQIGFFSNMYMVYATLFSGSLCILVAVIPGVMDLFHLEYLNGREWVLTIAMCLVPAIVDELTKLVYRKTGFGERPRVLVGDTSPHGFAQDGAGLSKGYSRMEGAGEAKEEEEE